MKSKPAEMRKDESAIQIKAQYLLDDFNYSLSGIDRFWGMVKDRCDTPRFSLIA